jgi:hypothetical protein
MTTKWGILVLRLILANKTFNCSFAIVMVKLLRMHWCKWIHMAFRYVAKRLHNGVVPVVDTRICPLTSSCLPSLRTCISIVRAVTRLSCQHNRSSLTLPREKWLLVLTSVSTWTLTFNWLSLYWLALVTCSSIPHRTASHPEHLRETDYLDTDMNDHSIYFISHSIHLIYCIYHVHCYFIVYYLNFLV